MVLKNQGDLPLPDAANPVGLPSGSKFMRGPRKAGQEDQPQVVLGNRAARRKAKKLKGAAPIMMIPAPPPVHAEAEEAPAPPMGAITPSIPAAKKAKPAPAKQAAPQKAAVKKAPVKKASAKKAAAKKAAPKKAAVKKKAAAKKAAPRKAAVKKKAAPKKAATRKPAKKAPAKKAGRRK